MYFMDWIGLGCNKWSHVQLCIGRPAVFFLRDEDLLDVVVPLGRSLESDTLRRGCREILQFTGTHRPLQVAVTLVSDDDHRRRVLATRSPNKRWFDRPAHLQSRTNNIFIVQYRVAQKVSHYHAS